MKIEIRGKPEFWLDIDRKTVDLLIRMSQAHYDSVCKNASERGGFLYGWRNHFDFLGPSEQDSVQNVHATWDQLDISLKICEVAQYSRFLTKNEFSAVWFYIKAITQAMSVANQLSKAWSITDVDEWIKESLKG